MTQVNRKGEKPASPEARTALYMDTQAYTYGRETSATLYAQVYDLRPDTRSSETGVSRKRSSRSSKGSAPHDGTFGCPPCALRGSRRPAGGTLEGGTLERHDFPTTDSAHLSPSQPGSSSPTLPRHPLLLCPVRGSHTLRAARSQLGRHLISA